MHRRTRIALAASVGALVGATASALSIYLFIMQPFLTVWSRSKYDAAVAEAKLSATELRLLRNGEHSKLTAMIESLLDTQILDAAMLEASSPGLRDQQAEKSIAVVREYRMQYPPAVIADKKLQDMQDSVAKALEPKPHSTNVP